MKAREAGLMPDAAAKTSSSLTQPRHPQHHHTQSTQPPPPAPPTTYALVTLAHVVVSLLFRLASYVFLRWIPTALAWPLIPILYAIYLPPWIVRHVAARRYKAALARQRAHTNGHAHPHAPRRSKSNVAASAASATANALGAPFHLLVGHATPRSTRRNLLSLAINSLLLLFVLDSYWAPHLFPSHHYHNLHVARIGHISPTTATVHVRYPFPLGRPLDDGSTPAEWDALLEHDPLLADLEADQGGRDSGTILPARDALGPPSTAGARLSDASQLFANPEPLRVIYRETDAEAARRRAEQSQRHRQQQRLQPHQRLRPDQRRGHASPPVGARRWERGPVLRLSAESDWTSSATLRELWPSTRYEWRLAFAHNNTFAPFPLAARTFVTWPDPSLAASTASGAAEGEGAGVEGAKASGKVAQRQVEDDDELDASVPLDDPDYFSFVASSCVKADVPYSPLSFWAWSPLLRLLAHALGAPWPYHEAPSPSSSSSAAAHVASALMSDASRRQSAPTTTTRLRRWATRLEEATRRNHVRGFELLAERVRQGKVRPRFFLSLGDLIYADVPRRERPTLGMYRKHWRNLFASASFRRFYEAVPVLGVYDDHEVSNDWAGLEVISASERDDGEAVGADDTEAGWDASRASKYGIDASVADGGEEGGSRRFRPLEAFAPANRAWHEYVASANPPNVERGENYYTLRYGNALAAFVLDTRKHRTPGELEDDGSKSMLGSTQRDALLRWLGAVNDTVAFKMVVSSIPFNSLWASDLGGNARTDTWAGFLTEREALLEVMEYVPNTFVLSGDRHEFAAVGLRSRSYPSRDAYPVWEVSISPLNMFYLPIRTLSQSNGQGGDPSRQELLYRYVPDGTSKHIEVTVDARDASQPVLRLRLVVDGEVAWRLRVLGEPTTAEARRRRGGGRGGRATAASGVGGLAKSLLELLGFRDRRWF